MPEKTFTFSQNQMGKWVSILRQFQGKKDWKIFQSQRLFFSHFFNNISMNKNSSTFDTLIHMQSTKQSNIRRFLVCQKPIFTWSLYDVMHKKPIWVLLDLSVHSNTLKIANKLNQPDKRTQCAIDYRVRIIVLCNYILQIEW
jgi:hypothetical protein